MGMGNRTWLTQVEHYGYTVDIEEGLKVYIAMSI